MYSLDNNKMTEEQRAGILTLVPKKGKDRTSLSNWRPITLLNADFEIYSKSLANRIQLCIKDVVQTDQTGFIRGRTIGSNIMNTQAVIDQVNTSQSTGLLLAIDYTKALTQYAGPLSKSHSNSSVLASSFQKQWPYSLKTSRPLSSTRDTPRAISHQQGA